MHSAEKMREKIAFFFLLFLKAVTCSRLTCRTHRFSPPQQGSCRFLFHMQNTKLLYNKANNKSEHGNLKCGTRSFQAVARKKFIYTYVCTYERVDTFVDKKKKIQSLCARTRTC